MLGLKLLILVLAGNKIGFALLIELHVVFFEDL
jgi:hypothetical protein